jgi:flagellar basal body-associated protein FliL
MSNPSEPDGNTEPVVNDESSPETEVISLPETEVISAGQVEEAEPERRFTAPSGFDAGKTQIIEAATEPPTEIFAASAAAAPFGQPIPVAPQVIPGRGDAPAPPRRRRSWGWVLALILVIAALAAVAILGTVLLSRDNAPAVSQEDNVRATIQNFDTAIQNGDLSKLRTITCGETADSYLKYDDKQWKDIHSRVAAARQYPVVASIDEVVVNANHAEANVTSFMAFDPATRSTRSFDLEFRDDQWKICQAPQ